MAEAAQLCGWIVVGYNGYQIFYYCYLLLSTICCITGGGQLSDVRVPPMLLYQMALTRAPYLPQSVNISHKSYNLGAAWYANRVATHIRDMSPIGHPDFEPEFEHEDGADDDADPDADLEDEADDDGVGK